MQQRNTTIRQHASLTSRMSHMLVLLAWLVLSPAARAQPSETQTDRAETLQNLIQNLKADLGRAPDPAAQFTRIGLLYMRLQQADSAAAAFRNAIAHKPGLAMAHASLGRVFLELKADARKALKHFQAAATADSTYTEAYTLQVKAYLALGQTGGRARKAAGQAIKYTPGRAEPYLLLARAYQEEGTQVATVYYYKKYLEQHPQDQETALEFATALLEAEHYRELETITARMTDPRALPLLAQALIQKRDHEGAVAAFEHYVKTLDPEEQTLYQDISLVGTPAEVRAFRLTPEGRRPAFLERFWLQKDPFKTSGGAMRKAEHYRRIWNARNSYGKKWPWDRRGEVYIRYGEPEFRSTSRNLNAQTPLEVQRIQEMMAHQLWGETALDETFVGPVYPIRTQRSFGGSSDAFDNVGLSRWKPVTAGSNWSVVPWEVWVYTQIGNGLEITFTDEFLSGNFDYAPIPSLDEEDLQVYEASGQSYMQLIQRLNEYAPATRMATLATTEPEQYSLETLEPLDFYYERLSFRGKNGKTHLQINVGLPIDNVALPTDPDTTVIVERRTALVYPRAIRSDKTKHSLSVPILDSNRDRGLIALSRVDLEAPPGEYELSVEAWRQNTDRVGVYREPGLALPNYHANRLMLSDIQIARKITEAGETVDSTFVRGKWNIRPAPSASFAPGAPLFVYFEIYNLAKDEFGATRYQISYEVQAREAGSISIIPLLAKLGGIKKAETIGFSFEQIGTEPTVSDYLELDLASIKPGRYILKMTVKDLNTDQTATRESVFRIPQGR